MRNRGHKGRRRGLGDAVCECCIKYIDFCCSSARTFDVLWPAPSYRARGYPGLTMATIFPNRISFIVINTEKLQVQHCLDLLLSRSKDAQNVGRENCVNKQSF